MKKRIGLVGYFGWGNFGDELFLKAHQEQLGDQYELEVVHDLLEAPYFSRPVGEVAEKYDAFIIGGGDLINPRVVSKLYWLEEYLTRPTFVFGIGVPSAAKAKPEALAHYKRFFAHDNVRLTIARDPESEAWIRANIAPKAPLEWYPDTVCAMARPKALSPREKNLGIVMRGHRSLDPDLSHVRALADRARELGYKVRHLVLANLSLGQADLEIAKSIAHDDEEIFTSSSLDEMCQEISGCSMLASIKFHGLIVATMYGVPSIAMSVTPKNKNFLKMIDRRDLLCGYTNEDLPKFLPWQPAPIHPWVRSKLRRDALRGYARLREELQKAL